MIIIFERFNTRRGSHLLIPERLTGGKARLLKLKISEVLYGDSYCHSYISLQTFDDLTRA
jgi:hypothetical protein